MYQFVKQRNCRMRTDRFKKYREERAGSLPERLDPLAVATPKNCPFAANAQLGCNRFQVTVESSNRLASFFCFPWLPAMSAFGLSLAKELSTLTLAVGVFYFGTYAIGTYLFKDKKGKPDA